MELQGAQLAEGDTLGNTVGRTDRRRLSDGHTEIMSEGPTGKVSDRDSEQNATFLSIRLSVSLPICSLSSLRAVEADPSFVGSLAVSLNFIL